MRPKVQWEEMFPDELDAALARCPVVYLPLGLCEPHGLHNALGVDTLKAHALCCLAAEEHGGIVAPPFFWHIHEIAYEAIWSEQAIGERNPWLTSLPPWVFFKVIFYQLRNMAARGFQAAVVFSGHAGGQEKDLRQVAEVFMRHSPLRVWAGADTEALVSGERGGDHAGRWETSVFWSVRPDLVDMSRLAQGTPEELKRTMATNPTASLASRRLGDARAAAFVEGLGHHAAALLAAYRPPATPASPAPGNPHGGLTFGETERLWQREIEPQLPGFVSMNVKAGQLRATPSSSWAPNEMSHDFLLGRE